jgi:hypothetical protein
MGMTATSRPADTDDALVDAACRRQSKALDELLARHLHPAWRIALVAAPDLPAAERAVVDGFCDALLSAHRHPDTTLALRERIVATTRQNAAAAGSDFGRRDADEGTEPVLAAFLMLPEAWRTAVWLSEVEGGTPEQVGKVLGVDRSAAAALTDRASAGLRDRLAADVAEHADRPECKETLKRLPALATGKLTVTARATAQTHVAACDSCSLWLAALIAPRPALRRLVPAVPTTLGPAIAERWAQLLDRDRKAWLAPWTERAIGTAAAAILAVGLAGVALVGGRDRDAGDQREHLAIPSGASPTPPFWSGSEGESAAGSLPVAFGTTSGATGGEAGNAVIGSTSGSGSGVAAVRPRAASPAVPTTPSSPTPSTRTNPGVPSTPTNPAAPGPAPSPEPEPPADDATQVSVDVGDDVQVGVGECTGVDLGGTVVGCDPPTSGESSVVVDLPGLPPIGL